MKSTAEDFPDSASRSRSHPLPQRHRWQPLRLGLVELFHYDSEEFPFHDGHLLLRGNNGTGKSKVLSLTLPFLFDAQLKPARIEPDGDAGKRMQWNLLMGSYDRRIGYAWIEFGRIDEQTGEARYLTLGAGLSAAAARPRVDSWYFIIEPRPGAPRINRDLWLASPQRVALTRERLHEALEGHGHIYEHAATYRRAVDERLFHLGARRYDALMDTLIQLRQPQLSRKPDERALSDALTEALPPLAPELLTDVADALAQLEEDRHQLEDYQALAKAVERFEQCYRRYAGTRSRRQAHGLRRAQTEFDNASRQRNESHAKLNEATRAEEDAEQALQDTRLRLDRQRARVQALLEDPANQDAQRLDQAGRDAVTREDDRAKADTALGRATDRLQRDAEQTAERRRQAEAAVAQLATTRRHATLMATEAGLGDDHDVHPLLGLDPSPLSELPLRTFDAARGDLHRSLERRREQIALVRRRHDDWSGKRGAHQRAQERRNDRRESFERAVAERDQADAEVGREGDVLLAAWASHLDGLQLLRMEGAPQFEDLTAWVANLVGENPMHRRLADRHLAVRDRLAADRHRNESRRDALDKERQDLLDERHALESGVIRKPPVPYTRGPETRTAFGPGQGAPLWQLLEFRDTADAMQRAGLEAALEAAGLLDAWVFPDGEVVTRAGSPWLDTRLSARPAVAGSLAERLQPDVTAQAGVDASIVQRLLAGIAAGPHDREEAEVWVAPDGRFRVGGLSGAWTKPAPEYIGFAAREETRRRRLADIRESLARLEQEAQALQREHEEVVRDTERADQELRGAPEDGPLRQAHADASAKARACMQAREQLAQADQALQEAAEVMHESHQRLLSDAADLRLPAEPDALEAVSHAAARCSDAFHELVRGAAEVRRALPEWQAQQARESETRRIHAEREEELAACRIAAEQAAERLRVLQESVGLKVEELRQRLTQARNDEETLRKSVDQRTGERRAAGEARAVAQAHAEQSEQNLARVTTERTHEIECLRQFAASGLLSSALPDLPLPEPQDQWTIEPALTLARRVEQSLQTVRDDDDTWQRIQRQVNEELTELHRALGALGHQASGETTDWGLIVRITYQNRLERPDNLTRILAEEIHQRNELLTANERAVLENHLQAEIASEIQRLLHGAERQLVSINQELHKRPTSTGVRYRLLWQPLSVEEGAPVGLEAARKRLLNTSADLWSNEDRQAIGELLQQRIQNERERSDRDDAGGLPEQLARALDYRRWHRFRVERWQDGQWRRLTGPASSGERALGLTVPLFAAVASFYSQGSYRLAPRLILLDEAFAGIDDAARAHCMGLIREFDLDFVLSSEREWGCYAELPGVSICQLQRREDVDAVFVSRWLWDGRSRSAQADPDRRFPPATATT